MFDNYQERLRAVVPLVVSRRDGVPLVLLYGGGSDIEVTFGRILPFLAHDRRGIALDEQGHDRKSDRDAPVAFETSADDVAALRRHLQVERADLLGFSNGANVALQLTLRHPELVRKFVHHEARGRTPRFWAYLAGADFAGMPQPLEDAFLRSHPDPQKLRNMHDKDLARMRSFQDVPDQVACGDPRADAGSSRAIRTWGRPSTPSR